MNIITELNKTYAQVKIGGKLRVWDGEDFLTRGDFVATEAGNGEMVGKKFVPNALLWLNSRDRRKFDKVVFYPGDVQENILNLWPGWNVKPKRGDYSLFRSHIVNNICDGHKKYSEWLWQWLAQLVQEPEIKKGTAVVLIGGKGCGKTIFADIIGELVGDKCYLTLVNGDSVTGRFNSMYEQCMLCTVDEAIWAGDKKGEGVIKNIVTTTKMTIERKGLECYSTPNYTRFIFTTNAAWGVPASMDERRFFVLNVNDNWTGDFDKFETMLRQMKHGGYAGLMYDLLQTKVDPRVNLRMPPKTDALKDQIEFSESPYVQFWRQLVLDADPEQWPREIKKEEISRLCMQFFKDSGIRQPFSNTWMFRELKKYINPWQEIRKVDVLDIGAGRKKYLLLPGHKKCIKVLK